jgi:DNA-binding NarL/FixJ family response regulator
VSFRLAPVTVPAMPTPILQFVPEGSEAMPTVRTAATSHKRDLLSPRERQIGAAYLRGLTRKEIAAELGLSENSVATFTKRLYTKLGIRRRGALAGRLAEILGGATAQ